MKTENPVHIKRGLDAATYHAANGVNASSFQYIDPERDGCPLTWFSHSNGDIKQVETPAMAIGTALHSYVLEPGKFKKEYVILDDEKKEELYDEAIEDGSKAKGFSKALSSYKNFKNRAAANGQRIITEEDFLTVDGLGTAAFAVDELNEFLSHPELETEISIFDELLDHQGNNVLCKGRIDAIKPNALLDLKTTVNTSPVKIGKFIANYKAYVQAAFYLDLCRTVGLVDEHATFSWCFIQKEKPHQATYYTAPEELIRLGRTEYKSWLGWIYEGRKTGNWPGHSKEVELPPYLLAQMEY